MKNIEIKNRPYLVRPKSSDTRIDWRIVFTILFFMLIGFLALIISFRVETGTIPVKTLLVQSLWWIIGWIIAFFLMKIDADGLYLIAPYAYGLGIFLLVAVLFLYDRNLALKTGAKSWFSIAGFTFQPSEVMKPAYILMVARVIFMHNIENKEHSLNTDFRLIFRIAIITIPVGILMLLQKDFGSTLVFIAIFAGMLFVSGISNKIILPIAISAMFLASLTLLAVTTVSGRGLLMKIGFQNYQFARIDSWLNPAGDTGSASFQLMQSIKAIGSGQFFGNGINGMKVHVPVRESDMIFSSIGESFGFIGGLAIILGYLYLIYILLSRTFTVHNSFYAYIATGVVMLISFHVFENIGMSIGLLPLTGIPLPFISQGGSSLLGNMIGIGMMLSMNYHNIESPFEIQKEGFQ
jgi:rod shape determining protein RodA